MNAEHSSPRRRWRRAPLALISVLVFALGIAISAGVGSAGAAGAPTYNLTGGWITGYESSGQRGAQNGSYSITSMNMSTGAFSGTAVVEGTSFTVSGTESGSTATYTLTEGSYVATDTLSLSVQSDGYVGGDGSFTDNNGSSGQFWAEQTSPSGTNTTTTSSSTPSTSTTSSSTTSSSTTSSSTTSTSTATTTGSPTTTTKQATGTQIICNYDFTTSADTCGASVGDVNPVGTAPTGQVTFSGPADGSFSSGSSCSLSPQSSAPTIGYCQEVFWAPDGTMPQITAAYSGDATHAASSGATTFLSGDPGGDTTDTTPTAGAGQFPDAIDLSTDIPADNSLVESCATLGSDPNAQAPDAVTAGDPVASEEAPLTQAADSLATDTPAQAAKVMTPAQTQQWTSQLNQIAGQLATEQQQAQQSGSQAIDQQLQQDSATYEQILQRMKAAHAAACNISRNLGQANDGGRPGDRKRIVKSKLVVLGKLVRSHVKAGPLKLKLVLNRAALSKLARSHLQTVVYLRLMIVLPSQRYPSGIPQFVVKRIVLKRGHAR